MGGFFHLKVKMLSEIKNKKPSRKKLAKGVISNKVKDYGNDPFFVKKATQSKEFLEKHGFAEELLSKK
jgi:hypothetical protein